MSLGLNLRHFPAKKVIVHAWVQKCPNLTSILFFDRLGQAITAAHYSKKRGVNICPPNNFQGAWACLLDNGAFLKNLKKPFLATT